MTYPPSGDPYGAPTPPPQPYGAPTPPPQYGAPAPQYGAPAPQYGSPTPAPQYGSPTPQYGSPTPAPQYGSPTPQYGAPTPPPPYGAPPLPYGTAPGYENPYGTAAVEYTSWIKRVGALLIDQLVLLPFYIIWVVLADGSKTAAIGFVFYLIGLVVFGYNRWYLAGKTGQSWGKKAVGVRLISEETGRPIGGFIAFVRDIAHFVDGIICYVGYLFPLWDAKKQTLSDKIMKTIVIR